MNITYHSNYEEMSRAAAALLLAEIRQKPDLLLCPATGNSPLLAYQQLAAGYNAHPGAFNRLRLLKLDEWGGIPIDHPDSCESFLKDQLIGPLKVSPDRYFGFDSRPAEPEKECERMQGVLQQQGPIDVCVLGLGPNGHIAMNEPATVLHPNFHIADLSVESLQHSMVLNMDPKPTYGITVGMADIMLSRRILLLITGSQKKWAAETLLKKPISTQLPASLLWLHPQVECLVDISVLEG